MLYTRILLFVVISTLMIVLNACSNDSSSDGDSPKLNSETLTFEFDQGGSIKFLVESLLAS